MGKLSTYKNEIIKELFFANELSATDLCNITGKSIPVVTKVITDLIKDKYVVENGYALSKGGRRPQVFSLANNIFYVVAIAVDQFITRAAIIDFKGNITEYTASIELDLKNNADALTALQDFINDFINGCGIEKSKIAGIGIGMPGFIDTNKGVNYSFFKTPSNTSLVDIISENTGLPVCLDNDSSLVALAELRMGKGQYPENTMVINLSWGIGLGMIINGEIFRGHDGFAGEFSHIPLFVNNKICGCGKSGCLETETSLYVLVEKAIQAINEGKASALKGLSFNQLDDAVNSIIKAAIDGDKLAIEILSDIAFNIGRGVAILIHIVNPGKIILSGRGAKAGKLWLAPLQQALNVYCIPRLAANTEVEISAIGPDAGLLGAAALVVENFGNSTMDKIQAETEYISTN